MGEQYADLERSRNGRKTVLVDPFSQAVEPGHPSQEFREKLFEKRASPILARSYRYPCVKCKKAFGKLNTAVHHLTKGMD